MRVLVCGGRDYDDRETLFRVLNEILIPDAELLSCSVTIIHGGAKGADYLADEWAVVNGCPIKEYHAQWHEHGKAAGPIRNRKMLEEGNPHLVVAFPGGRGTQNMMDQARRAGVRVLRVQRDGSYNDTWP